MTLQQLKYFLEIVSFGSMNEAAKHLYISQPSLSNSIKELENELGIVLFTRSNKGIQLSGDGTEFLGYARQVVEQTELLESRYFNPKTRKQNLTITTQHYSFSVDAFVKLLHTFKDETYNFTLRETRTGEIIDDVKNLKSEIGILYLNDFNEKVLSKLFKENQLTFTPLFTAKPHIFVATQHPLAKHVLVTLKDLEDYPCLSFEQGEYNSFYFSEEILSTMTHKKKINVSDRATLFNLLVGLNGYTISTGVINKHLNGEHIVSVPLDVKETITVGYITRKDMHLSPLSKMYLEHLTALIDDYFKD